MREMKGWPFKPIDDVEPCEGGDGFGPGNPN